MLAIIIPYYKLTFFEATLQSLANQTDKRFKVYIGDDASPEDCSSLLQQFEGLFNFKYHRFEINLGGSSLTKQWERCIALSPNEKWLMILGDDDYISNNYIEEFYKHVNEIEKLEIKVIRFATRVIKPSGKFSELFTHPKIENSTDFFFRKFLKFSRGSLSEQIFRRDAYLKHGFRDFPLGWGADNFAWLDFTEFGKIYTINDSIAYFRISSENISRGGYKDEIKNETKYQYFTLIIKKYLKKFKKEQRLPLLLYYEQIVYNLNKTSFGFWLTLSKYFILESDLIQIIKFTRRILIHLKKRSLNQ
jgi:glycosyltransferase involved in cell wall biosynthesis